MMIPDKGQNPDEHESSGFFSSHAAKTLHDLANTMLASRLIQTALSTFPKHWFEVMANKELREEFLIVLYELWEDTKDGA